MGLSNYTTDVKKNRNCALPQICVEIDFSHSLLEKNQLEAKDYVWVQKLDYK
jgi:hypothetical protein